jgi:hypothetical protein
LRNHNHNRSHFASFFVAAVVRSSRPRRRISTARTGGFEGERIYTEKNLNHEWTLTNPAG